MNRREFLALAAAAPFAVRSGAAFAMPAPLALVTCDTEARVAVVDVAAGRVVRSIPVSPDPRSVERVGGGDALVCHTNVGVLTIIDGRALRVRHVLHDFVQPRYTAAHPDRRHAFVTDSGSEEVVAVDLSSGRSLGRLHLGGWARHLTLDASARTLWVGLGNVAAHLAVVDVSDPTRPKFVRTVTPPFLAHDVGFLPGGAHVWVTSGDQGKMAVYHAERAAQRPRRGCTCFGRCGALAQHGASPFGASGNVSAVARPRHALILDVQRLLHEVHVAASSRRPFA